MGRDQPLEGNRPRTGVRTEAGNVTTTLGKRADNGFSGRVLECTQAGLLQRSNALALLNQWEGTVFDRPTCRLPFWELVSRLPHDF